MQPIRLKLRLKLRLDAGLLAAALAFLPSVASGAQPRFAPVVPNASPQAKALLNYLYDISGKGILGGVHGENWKPKRMYDLIKAESGKEPSFYSGDFRYGTDVEKRRRLVVDEMKNKWKNDKVICGLMWHMTRPLSADSENWGNVQSPKLTEAETAKLLTPGTDWNKAWLAKIDKVAEHLKELRDAGVPILWRPFHEMNGGWFWWGKNPRFDEIWIQMWDRYTNHHKLNNLIWVWSPNCVVYGAGQLPDYYPGHKYVDVLAEDIYANKSYDWEQYFYDDLMKLAEGRPIAMGEVGDIPDPAFLKQKQPNWTMFMLWPGYEHQYANTVARNKYVYTHDFTIMKDDLPSSLFSDKPTTLAPVRSRTSPSAATLQLLPSTPLYRSHAQGGTVTAYDIRGTRRSGISQEISDGLERSGQAADRALREIGSGSR